MSVTNPAFRQFDSGRLCLTHEKGSFYDLSLDERVEFFHSAVDQAYLDYGRLLTGRHNLVSDESPDPRDEGYNYAGPVDYLVTRLFNWMGLSSHFYILAKDEDFDRLANYRQIIHELALVSLSFHERYEVIEDIVIPLLAEYGWVGEWIDHFHDCRVHLLATDDV